jgi:hypothetical protein
LRGPSKLATVVTREQSGKSQDGEPDGTFTWVHRTIREKHYSRMDRLFYNPPFAQAFWDQKYPARKSEVWTASSFSWRGDRWIQRPCSQCVRSTCV